MLIRIWRSGVDPDRQDEYYEFARRRSTPMFQRHDGFQGLMFADDGPANRVVVTFWESMEAIAALDASPDYRSTVRAIEATGFLRPPQEVEVLELRGHLLPGWVADSGS